MKKILLSGIVLLTIGINLSADNPKKYPNIVKNLNEIIGTNRATVKDIIPLKDMKSDFVELEQTPNKIYPKEGKKFHVLAFDEGKIVIPFNEKMVKIITKKGFFYNKKYIQSIIEAKRSNLMLDNKIKKIKQKRIAKIYNSKKDAGIILDNNKDQTILMFLDPHCPGCNQELHFIPQYLTKYNVHVILEPLVRLNKKNEVLQNKYDKNGRMIKFNSLHPKSVRASIQLLNAIKKNDTNKEKLKKMNKYFSPRQKMIKEKIDFKSKKIKQIKQKLINNYHKYLKTDLINGTPYKILLQNK